MGGILAALKNKLRLPPPLSACPPNPERIMAAVREYALQIGGIRIYLSCTKLTDAFENNVLEPVHYWDPITNGQLSHVARCRISFSRTAFSFQSSVFLFSSRSPSLFLSYKQLVRLFRHDPHDWMYFDSSKVVPSFDL